MAQEIGAVLALREKLGSQLEQELGEIEMKVTTSYTLADAIREGAGVTDKVEGTFIRDGESCALGAAWIAGRARGYLT
jgi:hypothetical protein